MGMIFIPEGSGKMVRLFSRPNRGPSILTDGESNRSEEGTSGKNVCTTRELLSRLDGVLTRHTRSRRQKRILLGRNDFKRLVLLVRARLQDSLLQVEKLKERLGQARLEVANMDRQRLLQIGQSSKETNRERSEGILKIIRANESLLATKRRTTGAIELEIFQLEQDIPKLRELLARLSRLEGEGDETTSTDSEQTRR